MRFSIIVPVYNIEQYLDECIKSVLCQDYNDYELILIDDGSSDNSGKICDKYALNNKQIHVIHKHNGGPSIARNYGINEAKGEFIIFLDGDDYWASKKMLSELSAYIIEHDPDIIIFEGKMFWSNGNKKIVSNDELNTLSAENNNCSFETFIKTYLSQHKVWDWYAWLYIIRKDVFLDASLRFPEKRVYEDFYLTWRILLKAKKIGIIPKSYYMYRQGREGAITYVKSYKSIRDFLWVIEKNLYDVQHMNIDESVKKLLMGNFSNGYFTCCVLTGMLQKKERKKCIGELAEKKYLMEYAILPRYKYILYVSKIVGIENVIRILSLRYQWKTSIKSYLIKSKVG